MDPSSLLSMNLALNVARKCRICGMDIHDLTCAFPIFGSDRLDTKIERYLQLSIQTDDLLPKCVCGSCYLKLESIDQFAVMANRTEEAFRAWISRLRGLNSPEEAVKNVNMVLPLYRPNHQTASDVADAKGNMLLQAYSSSGGQTKQAPAPNVAPTQGIISYSDLKLGLLIKDLELLKLILKALKWAENDRKASFEVLIQRLKNSSFREVLSNRNLLNDSDLTQLLKSYIGQGVMNSFLPTPAAGGQRPNNNNVPPLVPLQPSNESFVGLSRLKLTTLASGTPASSVTSMSDYRIDEASVTQMEVGVDPDLYFPYDDEDSSSTTKFDSRMEDRQENTVTIKLVTANNTFESKGMIPAILNVRGSNRFQCSACPLCFPTNADLQQHIVISHLSKPNQTVLTAQGKPAIKIRVRKNKPAVIMVPKPISSPPSPMVYMASLETTCPTAPAPSSTAISFVPLKIPASTTITVVPMTSKADTSTADTVRSEPAPCVSDRKPLEEPPPKVELVRKSKRKPSIKSVVPEKKKRKAKSNEAATLERCLKPTRKLKSFCALCRKKLAARENIRDHMQQEHSRYECEKCDRAFKSALNLARHQQCHASSVAGAVAKVTTPKTQKAGQTDDQTHKCSFCGRMFKRSHHLKLHLNHHLKDAGRALVGEGNSLRKRTSVKRSVSIEGSNNVSAGRHKKRESTIRKSALTRKARMLS